jgi:hypothetical protein
MIISFLQMFPQSPGPVHFLTFPTTPSSLNLPSNLFNLRLLSFGGLVDNPDEFCYPIVMIVFYTMKVTLGIDALPLQRL